MLSHDFCTVYTAGAVVLQPLNPFVNDDVDLPEAIRYLSCNGTEAEISQCDIDTQEVQDCGRFEIAGVVCQGTSHQLKLLVLLQNALYNSLNNPKLGLS